MRATGDVGGRSVPMLIHRVDPDPSPAKRGTPWTPYDVLQATSDPTDPMRQPDKGRPSMSALRCPRVDVLLCRMTRRTNLAGALQVASATRKLLRLRVFLSSLTALAPSPGLSTACWTSPTG